MVTLQATELTKRFNYQTIIKNFNYTFESTSTYAVLGHNGSGKSTLLKILSGYLTPSEGHTSLIINEQKIVKDQQYKYVNFIAPYIQLIEDFTLQELLNFHFSFKEIIPGITQKTLFNILELANVKNKFLYQFSSGMKQRVKLIFAFLTQSSIILLDEPVTNLDDKGVQWYHQLVQQFSNNRLIIVASNRADEYQFCNKKINISEFNIRL